MKQKYVSLLLVCSIIMGSVSPAFAEDVSTVALTEEAGDNLTVDITEGLLSSDEESIVENVIDITDETNDNGVSNTIEYGENVILGAGEESHKAAEEAAQRVSNMIEALPSPEHILVIMDEQEDTNTKLALNDARQAYDALSLVSVGGNTATGLVPQRLVDKLRDCERADTQKDADIETARDFTAQVGHLPDAEDIQLSDEAELSRLEEIAANLTENERNRVDQSVFQHLIDARDKMTLLKNQEEQKTAEEKIEDYINDVLQPIIDSGEYTPEQQQQIQDIIDQLREKIEELVHSGQEITQEDIDALVQEALDAISQVETVHHVAAREFEGMLDAFKAPGALTLHDEDSVKALLEHYNSLSEKAKALVKEAYMNPGETYKDRLDALKNKISDLRTALEAAKKEAKAYYHNVAPITPTYYDESGITEAYLGIDGMVLSHNYDPEGESQLDVIKEEADRKINDEKVIDIDVINKYRDEAITKAKDVRDRERKMADAFENKIESLGPVLDLSKYEADTVAELRRIYDALPRYAKRYLETDKTWDGDTYAKRLEALETRIDEMATEDARAVTEMINGLPATNNITSADEGHIAAVRREYDALTKEAKAKMDSNAVQRLIDAEARLAVEKTKDKLKEQFRKFVANKKATTSYYPDQLQQVNDAEALGLKEIASTYTIPDAQTAYDYAVARINSIQTMKQRVKTYGVKKNFNTMKFRSTKQTEYKIWLRWAKVKNIAGFKNIKGYQLYRKKGSGKWKMIRQFDYKARSWKDGILDPGVKYTYKLVAFVVVDGEIIPVAESQIIYVFTKEGKTPKSNVKAVKVNKVGNTDTSEIRHTIKKTIKKKSTAKISAVEKPTTFNPIKRVRKLRYESTNKKIATVTQNGVIKGKMKGKCWIRIYSQTGTYRSIKVRVK